MPPPPASPDRNDKHTEAKVVVAPALDWRKLRLWQIQPIRDALIILAILGLLHVGYLCSIVTVPMLLALALAYLFEPVVAWVTHKYNWISRHGAAAAIIILAGALVVIPVTIGIGFAIVQGSALVGTVARNTGLVVASVQAEKPEERAAARQQLPRSLQDVGSWLGQLRTDVEAYRARRDAERDLVPGEPDVDTDPAPAEDPDAADAPAAQRSQTPLPDGDQPASDAQTGPDAAAPADADSDEAPRAPARPLRPDEAEVPEWKVQLYQGLEMAIRWVQNNAETLAKNIGQQALGTGAVAFGAIVLGMQKITYLIFTAFLTAFFFFFFCTSYGKVLEFWEDLIPERKKGRVIDLVRQMDRVVAGFVRGRITICFILAIYVTLAYWLIGVPSPLLLGPAIGLLFIVPFVHVVGVPIAIVLMAIEPGGGAGFQQQWWWIVFAPIGVYTGAQLLDDYVLSPTIQGKTTGMDTPTILFASFAGGALAGVYGLLLAIPVAACIRILLKEVFWPRFHAWGKGKERDFLPIARE